MQYGQIVFSLFTCLVIYYAVMAASDILKAKAAQSADGEGRDEEDIDISDEARTFKPVTVSRDEPGRTETATDDGRGTDGARPSHRPGHREAAMTDGILVEDLMEEVNRLAESGLSDLGQVIFTCENAM